MKYHIIAFAVGYLLDLLIGDPRWLPHPIRWIGNLIGALDHLLMDKWIENGRNPKAEKKAGFILVLLVLLISGGISAAVVLLGYYLHPVLGVILEAVITCYMLAARSLETESVKVYKALKEGTIEDARYAVSMIVGRDTKTLDAEGVTKAAVETVAENTSDGVIAPLIYAAIGGPILAVLYKAINTMDSMVGYHNDRYENFGFAPARLDDIVNFIPARLSAYAMILAAGICEMLFGKEKFSQKNAVRIYKRDRKCSKSPNAGETESVAAGALGVQLLGDASYFGKIVKKPTMGDKNRPIETEDISRCCRLMYVTEGIVAAVALICMTVIFLILR